MLNIAVCDDELIFAKEIKILLENYFKDFKIEINCFIFSNQNELMNSFGEIEYDVIFLDIELKNSNGINIAKEIRSLNFKGVLVFITSHSEFLAEGYKVEAFRYILKQNMEKELKECVRSMLHKIGVGKLKYERMCLDVNDIVYIESNDHKLMFHLNNGKTENCWGKLLDIEKLDVSKQLIRVHQSYIINLKYFKEIVRYKIILSGGTDIPIPRLKFNEVKAKITIRRSVWGQ